MMSVRGDAENPAFGDVGLGEVEVMAIAFTGVEGAVDIGTSSQYGSN